MSRNVSLIEALGLYCPMGGKPHICEGSWFEFVGCCTTDPCANNTGRCVTNEAKFMNATNLALFGNDVQMVCRDTRYQPGDPPNKWTNQLITLLPGKTNWTCEGVESIFTASSLMQGVSLPPYRVLREKLFSLPSLLEKNTTGNSRLTTSSMEESNGTSDTRNEATWGSLPKDDIIGLSVGIVAFALVLLALLGRYFWISETRKWAFMRIRSMNYGSPSQSKGVVRQHQQEQQQHELEVESDSTDSLNRVYSNWHGGLQKLNHKGFSWSTELVWDVLLTIAPVFFIVLAVLALCLNNQPRSSHGETVLNINRLIPTIYPIIFAAVAARFYKNLSRWHLEQPNGISLAVLEQIIGSQSFAGAIERLLFVRTQVSIALLILVIWTMSPLGGQAGARMVYHGQSDVLSYGTVYYSHPGYQLSSYSSMEYLFTRSLSVNSLYSSSLLQSQDQKSAPQDLWGLPKIPQWDKSKPKGETYEIDNEALSRGDNEYSSLLGTKIQGLHFAEQSNAELKFSVETSYTDFGCALRYDFFNSGEYMSLPQYDPLRSTMDLMKGKMNGTSFFVQFSGGWAWHYDNRESWETINTPSPHLVYMSSRHDDSSSVIMFNCSMETVILETEILCDLTSQSPNCTAQRQRVVDVPDYKLTLLRSTLKSIVAMYYMVQNWALADGGFYNRISSATDSYVAGIKFPYAMEEVINWQTFDAKALSRRLTTAFNSFHMATLDSLNHTDIAFRRDPGPQNYNPISPAEPSFLNSTQGTVVTKVEVYRTDKAWTAIHFLASFILLILAALGLALRLLIHGPDVVGFASSMTRDNPYVSLTSGGSALHGPERARLLKGLRVQLADVEPDSDVGYIAFRAVPSYLEEGSEADDNEQQNGSWRPFTGERLYR